MKTKWLLTLMAAALFALSASAGAAEVAIVNPGFESPPMDEGAYAYGADGWNTGDSNMAGVWNPGADAFGSEAPEGLNVAWVGYTTGSGGELSQVLTETLAAHTDYTLSVQVGNSPYYDGSNYSIELRAGGTILADFSEDAATNIPDDTFELRTATYTYDPLDAALLGEPLEIWLIVDGSEVDFDDVKLDAVRCLFMDPSPADGATVDPAGDLLLSWTNRDPNYEGHSVYVDVWFGTDPNHPSANWTKVVDAGEETTSVQVDASADGTYYWQVNSYIYGSPTGDPCEGCLWSFNVVSDFPPTVDAGVDMITWSGQPVSLDPTVVDDGVSDVTYAWTAAPADGVSWPDGADVKDAKVTIDKSGFLTSLVVNSGFESPELGDGEYIGTGGVPSWVEGYYYVANPGVWVVDPYSAGVINPDAAYGYGGTAAEGENVAYAAGYNGYDMGLSQILSFTLQANTQYDLSAKVGNPYAYNGGATNNYRIELVAGSTEPKTLLASDTGPSPTDDTYWTTASLTHNSGAAGTDPNVGQKLEIRLMTVDNGITGDEVNFDDVQLTATPAYPFPAAHTVTLTLAVSDEGNPTPVKDTMTIDVYDDECAAARIGLSLAAENPGDIDKNCITDLKDLAEMLITWLDTAPPEWP
jgi:hypothetical protein